MVFVIVVMRAVDNCRDAADGFAIAFGNESGDLTVVTVERGVWGEKFGDATRKRRHKGRVRFVKTLGCPLEAFLLRWGLADGNRKCFCGVQG